LQHLEKNRENILTFRRILDAVMGELEYNVKIELKIETFVKPACQKEGKIEGYYDNSQSRKG
jgi:hypothetical protein